MKQLKLKLILTVLTSMVCINAFSYHALIDGIYYNFYGDEAIVTYRAPNSNNKTAYQGNVVIPSSVNYNSKDYSVTSIDTYAFYCCYGLTSVTIPNSVTSIRNYAFSGCSGLKKVIVKDIAAWCGIKFDSFDSNPLCHAHHLYSDENTEITNLVIPNSVTSIGFAAFEGCSGLTSVTIGNSVTSIGSDAFLGCDALSSLTVSVNNPKYDSRENCNAIIETATNTLVVGIKSTVIPNSVTSISNYAFSGCSGLTSIEIPNSVTSIGESAFRGCSGLTSIHVDERNPKYDSRDNCNAIIEKETGILIAGCKKTVIPNSVTSIGDYAFYGCSGLTSIEIPNSVTSIGNYAFNGCSSLTSVTIGNSVTSIGNYAFNGCSSLTSVTIGNSVTSIGNYAFNGCSGLTSVTIPNSVTSIGLAAFSGCSGLTSIEIPNSVTSIGHEAFYECSSLTSIEIPNSVTSIGVSPFAGCSGLTSIHVDERNPKYDSHNNCNAIIEKETNTLVAGCKNTHIPNSVTRIGDGAFYKCTGLTSVTIPNSVTSIGRHAFYGCSSLTSIEIPNSMTSIGDLAFYNCSGLTSVTIPNSVTSIGWDAFSGCDNLTSVKVYAKTPPNALHAFPTSQVMTLYVPRGSKAAYQTASGWKDFSSIIEFDDIIKGDANGDGEVNVSDIVEIVNYIMNKPSDKFVFAAADMNDDGEVNVTDIVMVVSIIMSSDNNAPKHAAVAEMVDNDQLEMTSNDNQILSLNLQNEGSYVASQFDVVLSASQTLESIQLNSRRMENHQMTYAKTGDNRYKVVIYSLNNAAYKGQSGELLNIKVAGSGDVSVEDILFVTARQMEKRFPPLHRGTTGISVITNEAETMDIYTIDGRLIRKQAKSTDGLEKGLYIINGKKQIVR